MGAAEELTVRLSTKGQLILPKTIRARRGWNAGTRLVLEDMPDGVMLRPVRPFEPTRFDEVRGSLKVKGKPKTIDEMNAAVLAEARRRHART